MITSTINEMRMFTTRAACPCPCGRATGRSFTVTPDPSSTYSERAVEIPPTAGGISITAPGCNVRCKTPTSFATSLAQEWVGGARPVKPK